MHSCGFNHHHGSCTVMMWPSKTSIPIGLIGSTVRSTVGHVDQIIVLATEIFREPGLALVKSTEMLLESIVECRK